MQSELKPQPVSDQLPTPRGGDQLYKAAGELEGKKAIITGGDSGVGRAIAILYAMEGADSLIVYLPQEETDSQEAQRQVEQDGRKCKLMAINIASREKCQQVIDTALSEIGRVNILVNNAAFQMMQNSIADLSYEQWHKTFNTTILPVFTSQRWLCLT